MTGYYQPSPTPASLAIILAMLPEQDAGRLNEAFQFAAAAHVDQLRDEGTPFIEHPVRVASTLWDELGVRDVDILAAAMNHDVLEDCEWLDLEVVRSLLGDRSAGMIQDLTKEPVPEEEKEARDRAYLDRLPHLPYESRIIKLADRIDNLRMVLHADDPGKARRYLDVSREEFIPLALATDQTAARLVIEACDAVEEYLQAIGE